MSWKIQLLCLIFSFFTYSCTNSTISFADKKVENTVQEILKVNDRDLTRFDLRKIKELKLSGLHSVDDLRLFKSLRSLSITNSPELGGSIILPPLKKLKSLSICGTEIEKIDLSACRKFKDVNLSSNELVRVIFFEKNKIEELNLAFNRIESICLDNLRKLKKLYLSGNRLEEIDLTSQSYLLVLGINHNKLRVVDLFFCPHIETIFIEGNEIESLDLRCLKMLNILWCSNNFLQALDLSSNLELEWLVCENNYFSELDISANLKIERLSAKYIKGSYLGEPEMLIETGMYPKDFQIEKRKLIEELIISNSQVEKVSSFSLNENVKVVNKDSGEVFYTPTEPEYYPCIMPRPKRVYFD